ncbi:MAG: methyltransferase domain-containing protein [Candidatus Paceibacteria bacterium]
MKFNEKFDTIIAGNVIKHLENPSAFLQRCHKYLKKMVCF